MSGNQGMCARPTGGRPRLDLIDFIAIAGPEDSPEKLLMLSVISQAASNYLFFALGRNGTTADEFVRSAAYFFKVDSSRPESWQHARRMQVTAMEEIAGTDGRPLQKRTTRVRDLSDEDLKMMCFDRHYQIAGLPLPIDTFRAWLKRARKEIVEENRQQIREYVELLQMRALKAIPSGGQIPAKLFATSSDQVLIDPSGPEEVAELLYYHRRPSRHKRVAPSPESKPKFKHLFSEDGQFKGVLREVSICSLSYGPGSSPP